MRSWRLLSCTSMSDQALSARTRNCTKLLYKPTSKMTSTTRMPRKIGAINRLPCVEMRNRGDGSTGGSAVQLEAVAAAAKESFKSCLGQFKIASKESRPEVKYRLRTSYGEMVARDVRVIVLDRRSRPNLPD